MLVQRGLAPSRARARDAVLRGHVSVAGRPAARPGMDVSSEVEIAVDDPGLCWVSRAALKLVAALDAFGFDPTGRVVLDLGSSTGGFTQVLLARGAAKVIALDVGRGQMDPALAADSRVLLHEGLNCRDLAAADLPDPPEAIVADLSFISLRLALPAALRLAAQGAWLAVLVKPQFEVGPEHVGKGGIVRDETRSRAAAADIAAWLGSQGWAVRALVDSPIRGGSGNLEFLVGATRN
jgi:23S rRNA (cytidine1920-2'-O)/16S rRNA (cytidine1409-2'-O)-methyltransferase